MEDSKQNLIHTKYNFKDERLTIGGGSLYPLLILSTTWKFKWWQKRKILFTVLSLLTVKVQFYIAKHFTYFTRIIAQYYSKPIL